MKDSAKIQAFWPSWNRRGCATLPRCLPDACLAAAALDCAAAGPGWGRPREYAGVVAGAPRPQRVDDLARRLPAAAWRVYAIKNGAKGVIRAAFAFLRVHPVRDRVPGPESWLVLRRTIDARPELKYYLSNAPVGTRPETLVRLSGQRWPIERAFQECKDDLGMDHYETCQRSLNSDPPAIISPANSVAVRKRTSRGVRQRRRARAAEVNHSFGRCRRRSSNV